MLFPEQPATPSAGLVGIAKLAAASGLLLSKRSVEYRSLPVRSYIGRCSNPELPFEWTLNPYRGCEYGCKYCYARYSHEFMELRDGDDFETHIFAKEWNRAAFASELRHIPYGHTVAIGTVTDPYQPAERRFGITGQMLEVFRDNSTHRRLWMTTKSDLVARDAALLAEIAGRDNEVSVNVTITTLDAGLARELEPFAPRPEGACQLQPVDAADQRQRRKHRRRGTRRAAGRSHWLLEQRGFSETLRQGRVLSLSRRALSAFGAPIPPALSEQCLSERPLCGDNRGTGPGHQGSTRLPFTVGVSQRPTGQRSTA
jgi:hypothetical protein